MPLCMLKLLRFLGGAAAAFSASFTGGICALPGGNGVGAVDETAEDTSEAAEARPQFVSLSFFSSHICFIVFY